MLTIADIRKNYAQKTLNETDVMSNPISQFESWWREALDAAIEEPNAMTLATASSDGVPSARIVLLKDISHEGFSFYTNYRSFKAKQLEENPKGCLVFFWKELERQVRITGLVKKLPTVQSDEYFRSRPIGSQLGALVSPQSEVIRDRQWLDDRYMSLQKEYEGKDIPRPEHWGGYILLPVMVEFWQGRVSRLHDRLQYSLNEEGNWVIERLAP